MLNENLLNASPERLAPETARRQIKDLIWPKNRARLVFFFRWYVLAWIIPITLLIGWQVGADNGWIDSRLLSSPLLVARAAIKLTLSGTLLNDIAVSAWRALAGLVIGGVIGFVLGLIVGLSRIGETLLDTTIQMIRTIPFLSILPLVILWFGIEDRARIVLIALGVFFSLYINTFHGIRNIDAGLVEMGKSYGLSPWNLFWQVIFPGALPSILLGLRLALGVTWLGLIVAETLAANDGIGHLATEAREFFRTSDLIFTMILYALLGKSSDLITRFLERRLLRWHPSYQPTHKTRTIQGV
jgi:sulfonate transport system permease protein